MNQTSGITLLGLGPGDPGLLTRRAWNILESISEIHLRTQQHPVLASFPQGLRVYSFDELYEREETFDAVYAQIVEQVLELGKRSQGVVYAVPGHPFMAEATCPEIARRAVAEGIQVKVIEGISFLEPTLTAIGLDPFPHTALVDALMLVPAHVPPFPPSVPAIIAQIYSKRIASDVKLTLMSLYPDEHQVWLVHAAGTPQQKVESLALYEIDRSDAIGLLTSLYLPPLDLATSFEAFQEVIARLRAPDGCPWDKEQTHQSLRSHLIEETYEVLSALDSDDPEAMREELGDLLLQIVLHAQIASESGEFSMADVLQTVHDKIVNRHPHVFGDLELNEVSGVLMNWEFLKAAERTANGKGHEGLLDGVAKALPALIQAEEYQKRAARVGFDWPDIQGVMAKVVEEVEELRNAQSVQFIADEIGDLLFAIVNLARWYEVDAESALRETNHRFRTRFNYIERRAREQSKAVSELSLKEMESLWISAKKNS